jgi:hypothetical protein
MLDIFDSQIIAGILKFLFVTGALFYLLYTFIVFSPDLLMIKTLITSFSPAVSLLGLIIIFIASHRRFLWAFCFSYKNYYSIMAKESFSNFG